MHVQSCSFANLNLSLFLLLQKLPIVVIQTFGYHLASALYYSLQILMADSSFFFFKKKQQRNDCTMEFHQAYEFNVAEPRE